jgi:hypothetical protein
MGHEVRVKKIKKLFMPMDGHEVRVKKIKNSVPTSRKSPSVSIKKPNGWCCLAKLSNFIVRMTGKQFRCGKRQSFLMFNAVILFII